MPSASISASTSGVSSAPLSVVSEEEELEEIIGGAVVVVVVVAADGDGANLLSFFSPVAKSETNYACIMLI